MNGRVALVGDCKGIGTICIVAAISNYKQKIFLSGGIELTKDSAVLLICNHTKPTCEGIRRRR